MRTYRLEYSEDPDVLQRRLSKASACFSERILCKEFTGIPPTELAPQFVWAWEGKTSESTPSGWDEYHFIINSPSEVISDFQSANCYWVLEPSSMQNPKAWLQFLSQIPKEYLNRVFIEFRPWCSKNAFAPSLSEIATFLKLAKKNFPEWSACPRPGVEMWDSRIDREFNLEASNWREENFNFHSDKPELSIVIPTFNNKYFVTLVLKHLQKQTLSAVKFEVILVDDGGTDDTLSYLKTFGIPDRLQLKYVYWPRPAKRERGDSFFRAGLARNLGVRLSRADHLCFLDSDILVDQNFAQTVLQELQHHDVLQFPRLHIEQEHSSAKTTYETVDKSVCYVEEAHYWTPFFKTKSWMQIPQFWKYTCTYALALRKDDFLKAGRFKRFYVSYGFEDTELGYRLAKLEKRFHLVNQDVLHLTSYSQSEYKLSRSKRRQLLQKTAKQFFLSTLDVDNYFHLKSLMRGEPARWHRFKTNFGFRGKTARFAESD